MVYKSIMMFYGLHFKFMASIIPQAFSIGEELSTLSGDKTCMSTVNLELSFFQKLNDQAIAGRGSAPYFFCNK